MMGGIPMKKLIHDIGRVLIKGGRPLGLFIARYNPKYIYVHKNRLWKSIPLRFDFDIQDEESFYDIAKSVVESGRTLLKYDRLYVLWQAARNIYHMQLAAAEVGSFRGGSAYFIASALKALASQELPVHVFDTFEGHPQKTHSKFDPVHKPGFFSDVDYEAVKAYLSPFAQLKIHKGEFFETAKTLEDMTFGLVHIDVDIYRSTLDCLEYFGPRLASGGVIVVDDYGAPSCPGVERAIEEYLRGEKKFFIWCMNTKQVVLVKKCGSS